jgi:hypothetical protein
MVSEPTQILGHPLPKQWSVLALVSDTLAISAELYENARVIGFLSSPSDHFPGVINDTEVRIAEAKPLPAD